MPLKELQRDVRYGRAPDDRKRNDICPEPLDEGADRQPTVRPRVEHDFEQERRKQDGHQKDALSANRHGKPDRHDREHLTQRRWAFEGARGEQYPQEERR